jgi:MFS family permease
MTLIILFFLIGFISSLQVCGYPIVTESNPEHLTASASSISSMLIMAGGFVLPLFGWLMTYSNDFTVINNETIYSLNDFKLALSILPISYILARVATFLTDETGK